MKTYPLLHLYIKIRLYVKYTLKDTPKEDTKMKEQLIQSNRQNNNLNNKINNAGKAGRKLAMITAGAANTGYAIAAHFACRGYDICITSRSNGKLLEAKSKLEALFPDISIYAYTLDQSNLPDINRVFGKLSADAGRLDVFVANAANLGVDVDIFSADENTFDSIIDTNVKGTFFCCKEAAAVMMRQKSGSIVIMGSIQSKGAVKGRTVYSVSKGALNSLTKSIAFDLAPYGIRVNCIIAGAIHTSRWDSLDNVTANKRRSQYPLGREASPEDIANAVYYLATDLSSNTTGSEITVDAGLSFCLLPYGN